MNEEQATCKYCHEPYKRIEGKDGSFLRIGMTGGNEWMAQKPRRIHGAAIHTETPVGYENAEVDEPININYCPMCGRKLEAEK